MNPSFTLFGLNWDTISGLLRNVLLALSASFVTGGVIDGNTQQTIVSGVIGVLSVIWSYWSNAKAAAAKSVVKAVANNPATNIVPPSSSPTGETVVTVSK